MRVGSGAEGMKCMICMIFRLCMVCRKPSFRGYHANHANHAERSNHAGYRNHANHAKRSDHAGYRNHANHAGHAKAQKTALKRPRWPIRPAGGRMETQESLSVSCACVPLSVSPPCGRLASSPAGGAKRTAVKPGEQRVRRSCEQVCLTTTCPAPTGVLLAPPVGELSAKLTERATGRRSVTESATHPPTNRKETT